ncbi:MAG: hypothetical protein DPW09_44120 [Anaerolineae bacterium]|nr:response regulator [Anaerolineales bacterium]MCQ3980448.1 hypothetical protein [Anaerolineae bacterium]
MTCILTVDDFFENLFLCDLIFKLNGYEHLFTTDSCEAWAILGRKPVDLLIIDLRLPHINGWDFCEMMEAGDTFSQTPVILLSARGYHNCEEISFPKKISAHLQKPIDVDELPKTIAKVLKKSDKRLPTPAEIAYWKNFSKPSIEERLAALQDCDPLTRRSAIWNLAMNTPKVVEAVIERLGDEDFLVLMAAVQVLRQYRVAQAIAPLRKLIDKIPPDLLAEQQDLPISQWSNDVSLAWHAKWAIDHIKAISKQQ